MDDNEMTPEEKIERLATALRSIWDSYDSLSNAAGHRKSYQSLAQSMRNQAYLALDDCGLKTYRTPRERKDGGMWMATASKRVDGIAMVTKSEWVDE